VGKPGFPTPLRTRAGGPRTQAPAPGRVWEGYALPGRTFFHPVGVYGAAAWTANVNIRPWAGGWGNRVSPSPRPRKGLGGQSPPRRTLLSPCGCGPEARAPGPRPTGGSGRAAPSQEQPIFIPSVRGGAAWTANVNIRPRRGEWGNRVSPYPRGRGPPARAPRPRPLGGFARAQPLSRGMGKPGFSIPSPGGKG